MKTNKTQKIIALRAKERIKPTTSQEMVTWFHYQYVIENTQDLTLKTEQVAWDRYRRNSLERE